MHKNGGRLIYASSLRQQNSQPPYAHMIYIGSKLHLTSIISAASYLQRAATAASSSLIHLVLHSSKNNNNNNNKNNNNNNNNRTSVPPALHGPGHTSAQKSFFHAAHQTDDAHHTSHANSSEDSLDSDDDNDDDDNDEDRRLEPLSSSRPMLEHGLDYAYVYDTCMLVDCSVWRDDMATCVKGRFPSVDIRIMSSSTSLSGFCVVMRMCPSASELCASSLVGANRSSVGGDNNHMLLDGSYEMLESNNSSVLRRCVRLLNTLSSRLGFRCGGLHAQAFGVAVLCCILQATRMGHAYISAASHKT